MKYKTRGSSNPDRKAKVYFCCHPEDFNVYFESITNEILSFQDCAIWYDDETSVRDELFYNDLKQMLLFVMPVTSRLLTNPSRAMDEDFAFALKNHIPVLPLVQENDLDSLYSQRFGDLQYLLKNSSDKTEISYEDKLKKYLFSVLLDDETIKKIQAAFDAYIFLSYRKKDRIFAQELMRLIHKNDFCRDIAIWYDEFLTPGEDFNKTIREALEKSGFLVLAVTPSLLEPIKDKNGEEQPNYVEKEEYPMAKRSGKPILPAEMVLTDKEELAKRFSDIPVCTDARDNAKLSKALLESLEKIAKRENDNSPEHNFFIGLAYLNGIDVEVDHTRAFELITFAAEHNIVEAMNKLIDMYNSGFGVERNFKTAIFWHEKKIQHLKNIYDNSPTEENFVELFWAIVDCGDAYNAVAELENESARLENALSICQDFSDRFVQSRQIKRCISVGYNRLGDVHFSLGKTENARICYERALEISKKLADDNNTVQSKRDLTVCFERLGDIFKSLGKIDIARDYYEKCLEADKAIVKEEDTVETKRELSISFERLGNIFVALGSEEKAKEFFEKCLDIRKSLAEETNSLSSKRDLSFCYHNLGDISKSLGRIDVAKEYYEKALEIRKSIADETQTIQANRDLAFSLHNLGGISKMLGRIDTAREFYEKSLEIFKSLANQTSTIQANRDLAVCYNNLGDLFSALEALDRAKGCYENALELLKLISKETNTLEIRRDIAVCYNNLGDLYLSTEHLDTAKIFYENSLEIRRRIFEESNTLSSRRDLAVCYNKLGDIFSALEMFERAKGYYENALDIAKAIAKETNTLASRRDLSFGYDRLGNVYKSLNEIKKAKEFYENALEIDKAIAEDANTIDAKRDLAISHTKLGDLYVSLEQEDIARAHYENALEIRKSVVEETNEAFAWYDLAISYFYISFVANGESKEYLLDALDIMDMLCESFPENELYHQHRDVIKDCFDSL